MLVVYLLNVTSLEQEMFPKALASLPKIRQEKVLSYVFEKDQRLSLGAGLLLEFWRRQQQIPLDGFTESDRGKPELSAQFPFFFNLSHAEEYVLFAASSHPIGVDIEKIASNFLEIAEAYFTKQEQRQIFSTENIAQQEQTFFRLWTLKESYMKATGQGFHLPLHSFSVELGEKAPFLSTPHPLYEGYSLTECNAPPGYQASLCLFGEQPDIIPKQPTEITVEQLFKSKPGTGNCSG